MFFRLIRLSVLLSLSELKEKRSWLGMIPTRASLPLCLFLSDIFFAARWRPIPFEFLSVLQVQGSWPGVFVQCRWITSYVPPSASQCQHVRRDTAGPAHRKTRPADLPSSCLFQAEPSPSPRRTHACTEAADSSVQRTERNSNDSPATVSVTTNSTDAGITSKLTTTPTCSSFAAPSRSSQQLAGN